MARKLSPDNVHDIRATYQYHTKGCTMKDLGEKYGVTLQTIDRVIKKVLYKDVQ